MLKFYHYKYDHHTFVKKNHCPYTIQVFVKTLSWKLFYIRQWNMSLVIQNIEIWIKYGHQGFRKIWPPYLCKKTSLPIQHSIFDENSVLETILYILMKFIFDNFKYSNMYPIWPPCHKKDIHVAANSITSYISLTRSISNVISYWNWLMVA